VKTLSGDPVLARNPQFANALAKCSLKATEISARPKIAPFK